MAPNRPKVIRDLLDVATPQEADEGPFFCTQLPIRLADPTPLIAIADHYRVSCWYSDYQAATRRSSFYERTAMLSLRKSLASATLAMSLAFVGTTAHATTGTPNNPVTVTNPELGEIIEGGTTQSVDPTRYDYVPDKPQAIARSAWGHQAIGGYGFSFKGLSLKIPAGTLAHDIQGGSTYIRQEAAQYVLIASASICNYRIDFQNRDLRGRIVRTYTGNTVNKCARLVTVVRQIRKPFHVQPGVQCARLYVGGKFRGEQCHNIVK